MGKFFRTLVPVLGMAAVGVGALQAGERDGWPSVANTVQLARSWTAAGMGERRGSAEEAAGPAIYRLTSMERMPMIEKVSATGTLAPVALVSVSSQVSGQIKEVYAEYNQEVSAGQPLALIDPVTFEIAVEQAEAEVEVAQAGVLMQEATIARLAAEMDSARFDHAAARANTEFAAVQLTEAEAELDRKRGLGSAGSKAELERADSATRGAEAQLRSAQAIESSRESAIHAADAQLRSARTHLVNLRAILRQREATLRQAAIELERTVIRAPVDGMVTTRSIEVGTAVAVSLQAPALYTLAQDLRDMQVNASVTETEIGRIRAGQRFEFAVDAYPDRVFTGQVLQVRMHPQTTQNVVSYTVIATAPNPELLLLPGMTATANVIVDEIEPELAVVTAALRFRPPGESRTEEPRLYILREGTEAPVGVPVELGPSEAGYTAVRGADLDENSRVVVGLHDMGRESEAKSDRRILGLF